MEKTPALLQEIHAVELGILKECSRICEKNNIPYYLCYGSLLGAVRHGGFIPWDDDIDIMMPSHRIAEFKKCFHAEADEAYFYSDIHTEEIAIEPWVKIRKNNTTSMPRMLRKIPGNWGICIDIFPLYAISGCKALQKSKKAAFYLAEGMLRAETAKHNKECSARLKAISLLPYALRKLAARLLLAYLESGRWDSEYVFDGYMVMRRADIEADSAALQFEDSEFAVPAKYREYLAQAYGDYMQLPPEEERCGHDSENGEIIWDTRRGAAHYQG